MRTHAGAIATAVPLALLSACLAFEPITETPPPVDSAPVIVETYPATHQVFLTDNNNPSVPCLISLQVVAVAPQGQQLYAEFYLNFQSVEVEQAALTEGGLAQIPMPPDPNNSTLFQLNVTLYPLNFPASLVPASANGLANLITVFVSDSFPPDGPIQPSGSNFYTTSWDWQMVVTDPNCQTQLDNIIQ